MMWISLISGVVKLIVDSRTAGGSFDLRGTVLKWIVL